MAKKKIKDKAHKKESMICITMYGPPVKCKKKIMSIVQKTNAAMYPAYS